MMHKSFTLPLLVISVAAGLNGCNRRDNLLRLTEINRKFSEERYAEVIVECREYLRAYPESCQGWGLLGWAYLRSDSLDAAFQSFDKALDIYPGYDNAYVGKGVAYRTAGNLQEARKSYMAALEIESENPEAFSSLVAIEIAEGNYAGAVEYGEKARELSGNDPVIAANLSIAYHYNGQYAERDAMFAHAKRLGYHNIEDLEKSFAEGAEEPPPQL